MLTVAPLAAVSGLTMAAHDAIMHADKLFLQTERHPAAKWIVDAGLSYVSMDDIYDSSDDFDALNASIAARLAEAGDAVFAVLGRGLAPALRDAVKGAGIELAELPSPGMAEAACCCANTGLPGAIYAANGLPASPDMSLLTAVEEIDTRVRAGEVKLYLSEYYPDGHSVTLCTMDKNGAYSAAVMPLYELDRQKSTAYHQATVLIVPPCAMLESARHSFDALMDIVYRLRAPGGCPWDIEQTHATLRKSIIEEAYEAVDAIDRDDMDALCEELGDVLLQVTMNAAIASERADFTIRDVTTGIVNKLIYRHPHVFGDTKVAGSADVLVNWEKLKKAEKHQDTQSDAMNSIPRCFPSLMRAEKAQKKARDVGFDWPDAEGAFDKIDEEIAELREAAASGDKDHIAEEAGDLLFACVNAVRLSGVECELSLTAATDKFIRRFTLMEQAIIADRGSLDGMTLSEMDAYWDRVKRG